MSSYTVQIKPTKTIATVSIVPSSNITLGTLTNVDTSGADDGEVLTYDSANNKYVLKEVVVNSNNVTNINGGTF